MTTLSAQSILKRCHNVNGHPHPMIHPFNRKGYFHGMSFGLSHCGYDVRIDQATMLYPGDYVLASTIESFDMPLDLRASVTDKSSWARRGVTVQNTILEPGWRGFLTLEISYHGQPRPWWWIERIFGPWRWQPIHLPGGMPIAQIVFELLDEPTDLPYAGKYQDQARGPVGALKQDGTAF